MKINKFFKLITSVFQPFIFLMNLKAKKIGMRSSRFLIPSGHIGIHMNYTTPRDMLKLFTEASKNPKMLKYMGADSVTIDIKGKNKRKTEVTTTMDKDLKLNYDISGGKTGNYKNDYCVGAVKILNGTKIIGIVMGCTSSSSRFEALKNIFDISSEALINKNYDITNVTINAKSAIACAIKDKDTEVLFEKNADEKHTPASMTKVLTLLTALDYIKDTNKTLKIKKSDIIGGSGDIFKANDIISFDDAFFAMMVPSSNQAAHAISRETKKYIRF